MYTFREFYIPDYMMESLDRYLNHGILPGGFLQAVLSNDLAGACERADSINLANIPAYVGYLYNEAPRNSYGSYEQMIAYAEAKRKAA